MRGDIGKAKSYKYYKKFYAMTNILKQLSDSDEQIAKGVNGITPAKAKVLKNSYRGSFNE